MNLETATREELIQLIVEQEKLVAGLRAQIDTLERQIANLEGEFSGQDGETLGDPSPAWVKPKRSKRTGKPRKKRTSSYGRKRSKPTRQVIHAVETCRQCGCQLKGGSVKRTREVLHIPLVPAEVVEHVFVERRCPLCNLRQTPGAEVLRGEVLGQHRVSLQTMAIITALREEGRLPIGVIQWFLQALYGLELSQGEIVAILHAVAAHGRGRVDEIRQELRTSPVVHGDETGWREDGQDGYFWSFSTPQVSYFEYRHSRAGQVVEDIMGQASNTTMVSDFYGAYNRHRGVHQRCWAHLLRDIHDLRTHYPDDAEVQAWGQAVHALYLEACALRERLRDGDWLARVQAAHRFEGELMALCEPFLEKEVPQRVLCQRCKRFLNQLFYFVVDLRVPPDNNAAERAIRPLTVSRKISGGTRSPLGSQTKGILASLFETWRLQALDPLVACSQLLASPQI
jgi:transposase